MSVTPTITPTITPTVTPTNALLLTTWNPLDKATDLTLSNNNHTVAKSAAQSTWSSARSVSSYSSGKKHAEIECTTLDALTSVTFGVVANGALGNYFGANANEMLIQGKNSSNRVALWFLGAVNTSPALTPVSAGGIAMLSIDFDAGKLWLGVNGVWFNSGNPAAGTNATYTFTSNITLYLGVSVYRNAVGTLTVPIYTPSGFTTWI